MCWSSGTLDPAMGLEIEVLEIRRCDYGVNAGSGLAIVVSVAILVVIVYRIEPRVVALDTHNGSNAGRCDIARFSHYRRTNCVLYCFPGFCDSFYFDI
jgi:hypothetical protein